MRSETDRQTPVPPAQAHSRVQPTTPHHARGESGPSQVDRHRDGHVTTAPARGSWRVERRLLAWVLERVGRPRLTLRLWDGTVLGEPQSAVGQIVIHAPSVLRQLCLNPALSFGECYTAGTLTVEGDLIAVMTEINLALARGRPHPSRSFGPSLRFKHSLAQSKSNVAHHYDLGNDFYRLWLDPQLVYTCAYYPTPATSLEEAQVAKLDYVCRKLRLQPGERVIEAGCGWGALALHMARHYGVTVRAYNISREQIAHCHARATAEGLSDRVTFIEEDYRRTEGQGTCDVFVSVGMLEHVGTEAYRELGRLMSRVLTPAGRGLIHTIGRNVSRPLDPWTNKYIFPGARPPSIREMMDLFEESDFSVLDLENLRLHYARTCADWLARFEAASEAVRSMFDQRFVRMWRLYLAASSATFISGDLQLFQLLFARSSHNEIPWTRADWYATPLAGPADPVS